MALCDLSFSNEALRFLISICNEQQMNLMLYAESDTYLALVRYIICTIITGLEKEHDKLSCYSCRLVAPGWSTHHIELLHDKWP